MTTKKKLLAAMIALLILAGIVIFSQSSLKQNEELKEVTLDIITEQEKLTKVYQTTATTLKELLSEQTELQAVLEDGMYGAYLTSMLGKAQADQGPWWVYSSENNDDCTNMNMCPSLEQVNLQTGDIFIFSLTSEIN